ncbi:ArsR family transcriptional regulator [Sulfuracidifex metallicus]|uniref:ArsR family transcriptional regulator n=1 Tax=Sulfuracidifex metallicus DSM 6482 = JCM 9184 TaxID=523847 RepID=A0A6A9QNT3_SULME|nr:ArsR family transcriptional regulator [Sulfuracidifex metallicus]MUN29980.1 ArsR family transcriptional regulator [Sulfuracidifex metallicus DSM 6482 = JCM 9184]
MNANIIRGEVKRRKILRLLAENYVLSASLLSHTLLLSYGAVMYHLRILRDQQLIEMWKEGEKVYVKLKENTEELKNLNEIREKNIHVDNFP